MTSLGIESEALAAKGDVPQRTGRSAREEAQDKQESTGETIRGSDAQKLYTGEQSRSRHILLRLQA